MNYNKYDTICCKWCFLFVDLQWIVLYLLICNELFCIDPENQLIKIINTMNIIKIQQPSKFNVFLHGYFTEYPYSLDLKKVFNVFKLATLKFLWNVYQVHDFILMVLRHLSREFCSKWSQRWIVSIFPYLSRTKCRNVIK